MASPASRRPPETGAPAPASAPGLGALRYLPAVMGVVNATPDSFYAASRGTSVEEAVHRGMALANEGADMLDVGGESTRPGAEPVPEEEECARALPVVESLAKQLPIPISIDTRKPEVARRALAAGARILNDVGGLRDPGMIEAAKGFETVLLMHMQGDPRTMQQAPRYRDVAADLLAFFRERLEAFRRAGGDPARVWLDPGIGFGKSVEHNLEILARLEEFRVLGRPLVVGASRKSFIGLRLSGDPRRPLPPEERLEGSLGAACRAALAGVRAVRVHDVRATKRALLVFAAAIPKQAWMSVHG